MGDMYHIDLSSLPKHEQENYIKTIDKLSFEIFPIPLQPGTFEILWDCEENIYEKLNLPEQCNITKL